MSIRTQPPAVPWAACPGRLGIGWPASRDEPVWEQLGFWGVGVAHTLGLGQFSLWVHLAAASKLINSSESWRDLEAQAGALLHQAGRARWGGIWKGCVCVYACVCVSVHSSPGNAGVRANHCLPGGNLRGWAAEMGDFPGLLCPDLLASDTWANFGGSARQDQRSAGHSGPFQAQPASVPTQHRVPPAACCPH